MTTRQSCLFLFLFAGFAGLAFPRLAAQGDPQPTCKMCPGTYIPKSEVMPTSQRLSRKS